MQRIVFAHKYRSLLCKFALVLVGIVCCSGCSRSEKYDRGHSPKNRDEIKSALGCYEADIGTYPSTTDGLEALVSKPSAVPAPKWHGPYIPDDSGLKDP
jgi:general secretion pathway protein G